MRQNYGWERLVTYFWKIRKKIGETDKSRIQVSNFGFIDKVSVSNILLSLWVLVSNLMVSTASLVASDALTQIYKSFTSASTNSQG